MLAFNLPSSYLTDIAIERINRDLDDLTPLDARNSLLIDPTDYKDVKNPQAKSYPLSTYSSRKSYDTVQPYRDETPPPRRPQGAHESSENLVSSAADMGYKHDRSVSRESDGASSRSTRWQPTIPNLDYHGQAY